MAVSKTAQKVETNKENGKDFVIMHAEGSSLYKVGYEGGGEVPKELAETLYTSITVAEKAIEAYKAKRG